jgi:hypothetical protein
MNQQPLVIDRSQPLRVYTDEQQRLRWALIIEAILHDSGPSPPIVARPITSQPVTQTPRQAV